MIIPSQYNMANLSKNAVASVASVASVALKPNTKIDDDEEIENILADVLGEPDCKSKDVSKLNEENIEDENEKSPLLMIHS
jgi:hypothetical protein